MKQNKSARISKTTQNPEQIIVLGKATSLTLGFRGKSIENRRHSADIWRKK